MSMTPTMYECDGCGASFFSSIAWGLFDYISPNGERINLERCRGWCYACKRLAAIESLSTLPAHTQLERSNAQLARKKKGVGGFLSMLSPRTQWMLKNAHTESQEALARLALLASRNAPPRCLHCGSDRVEPLPAINPREPVRVNFSHPGCGGDLWARESDIRYSFTFMRRLYDAEGNFIREEEDRR